MAQDCNSRTNQIPPLPRGVRGKTSSPILNLATTLLFLYIAFTPPAHADWQFMFYLGHSFTQPGRIHVNDPHQPRDIAPVKWLDQSLRPPLYYGLRINYWLQSEAGAGVGLDFTHAKIIARLPEIPEEEIDNNQPILHKLALTHGYNFLTVNALARSDTINSGERYYTGAGIGFAVPHVELHYGSIQIDNYRYSGLVAQALAGVQYQEMVVEYKVSRGWLRLDLEEGSWLGVEPITHHFDLGLGGGL